MQHLLLSLHTQHTYAHKHTHTSQSTEWIQSNSADDKMPTVPSAHVKTIYPNIHEIHSSPPTFKDVNLTITVTSFS